MSPRVLIRGRQECPIQRRLQKQRSERVEGATLLSLSVEEGPQVKGCRQPLEAGKSRK